MTGGASTLSALLAEGKGDRAIATALGVTRHRARELIREAERAGNGAAGPSNAILRYDAACHALAEAKSFDEVRDWEDKAAAVKEYSRRARNRSLELDALEIRERARLRRGQLLLQLRATGQLVEGRPDETVTSQGPFRVTLDDLDVTKNESSRDQKIAKMEGGSFERLIARCRSYAEEHPEKHTFDVLKAPNETSSVWAGRHEPDESLDYFPTPPWATRALMQHVLPAVGFAGKRFDTVWEPACGEGHIAEVLAEYSDHVSATDIHDYGYGQIEDFLGIEIISYIPEWIITNPPFGDKALPFVLRALDLANVGVAMFVRSQWAIEGIERYESLFRDRPPTLCAFFVERVNLCKGRWEPDGTTAMAYCWLVWVKDKTPLPTFWIPPGCRESLTRPDDAERFTTHPVIKRGSSEASE